MTEEQAYANLINESSKTNTIMHAIQIIYLISSLVSVVAMWPQIKQLFVTKQSDELSIPTWLSWTLCQVISVVYAYSIHALPYFIACVSWLVFYLLMLTMILKYRHTTKLAAESVAIEPTPSYQFAKQ
ncbi:MAG: PQ-loop domain-containing transporter [Patescibacteria group bacterium]|nr:PQ-loop domain-containing transporter [Patescibacteria group bacterium]